MEASVSTTSTSRFASPENWLDLTESRAAADLIAASADVALFLDHDGVVRDLAVAGADLSPEEPRRWLGRPWVELVTVESRDKVLTLLDEAAKDRVAKWREINHKREQGGDLPFRFLAMKLGKSGVVALGRDLSSVSRLQQKMIDLQRSIDRQYGRLRNAETRYRLLFQLSSEPVLIVDVANGKVTEANGAAQAVLTGPNGKLVGKTLADLFAEDSDLAAATAAARSVGRADPIRLRPKAGETAFMVALSAFRQENGHFLLARLSAEAVPAASDPSRAAASRVLDIVRGLPEGFVVIDAERRILDANDSFLQLAELATLEQARGERLDRWLGRPGVDVELIVSNLREHGSLRDFATIVRGEYDTQEEVEVTAVSALHGPVPCHGLLIRPVQHRLDSPRESDLSRSVGQMTELVGRVALKDLVRETTDLVEQMCIQAALDLTGDNRASAAQILGLSRQGLYAKLRRYGIGDLDGDSEVDGRSE